MSESGRTFFGRQFRFNWGVTLFTLCLFPVLISLGLWQLEREQNKILVQNRYEERSQSAAIPETEIDWAHEDLGWMPISAQGNFNNTQQYLLDNRILESRVGYEVITPFTTPDGHTLLVNRGWIAQGATRADIPDLGIDEALTAITGHIYVPDGDVMVLGPAETVEERWPRLIQKVDIQQMSNELGTAIRPHIVRLDERSNAVLRTNWMAINMRPETHRAYAVQWFTMAFVLLILYVIFSFRRPEI